MQGESRNDHEREDDVEREGNRKEWGCELERVAGGPEAKGWLCGLVNVPDTCGCNDSVR